MKFASSSSSRSRSLASTPPERASRASDAQANNKPRLNGLTGNFMVQKNSPKLIFFFFLSPRMKTFPDDSQRSEYRQGVANIPPAFARKKVSLLSIAPKKELKIDFHFRRKLPTRRDN